MRISGNRQLWSMYVGCGAGEPDKTLTRHEMCNCMCKYMYCAEVQVLCDMHAFGADCGLGMYHVPCMPSKCIIWRSINRSSHNDNARACTRPQHDLQVIWLLQLSNPSQPPHAHAGEHTRVQSHPAHVDTTQHVVHI